MLQVFKYTQQAWRFRSILFSLHRISKALQEMQLWNIIDMEDKDKGHWVFIQKEGRGGEKPLQLLIAEN